MVIATAAGAALLYLLLDVLLLLFLGVMVAATLQPWHVRLCGWGVPKGVAVLLIYSVLLASVVGAVVLIAPVVMEQAGTLVAELLSTYARTRESLQGSRALPLRLIGQGLPASPALPRSVPAEVAAPVVQGVVGATTGLLAVLAYIVAVFAAGFYWTLEVPRIERLVLSLVPVQHRARTLTLWHEVESRLGAFMRGQGLAMLVIGVASAIGYALIGLPHVLVLGVLAGLLEAVPLIGPVLAAVPAVIAALPLGVETMLLVIALATLLQVFENNVLIPRIMDRVVGISALVAMFAVLAFGTLYGVLGVFIAIPVTAVIQIVVEELLLGKAPGAESIRDPYEALLARLQGIAHQARLRLRGRETRMGIDPESADHTVDAMDQRIEEAVERVAELVAVTRDAAPVPAADAAAMVALLQETTDQLAEAVEGLGTVGGGDAALDTAAEEIDGAVERLATAIKDPATG